FVGAAAKRTEDGQVNYLNGRPVWEALMAVIPRALWPEKPVFGRSPKIVAEMTGLKLSPTTPGGVGTCRDSYMNFGMSGLDAGFLLLGWALGSFDSKAAAAEIRGDLGRAIIFFLPGAALVQPLGALVELTGGAGAALVAAYGWKWAWTRWADERLYATSTPVNGARKSP